LQSLHSKKRKAPNRFAVGPQELVLPIVQNSRDPNAPLPGVFVVVLRFICVVSMARTVAEKSEK
jgi:hypothetical protein